MFKWIPGKKDDELSELGIMTGNIKSSEIEDIIPTPFHSVTSYEMEHMEKLTNCGLNVFSHGIRFPNPFVEINPIIRHDDLPKLTDPMGSGSQVEQIRNITMSYPLYDKLVYYRPIIRRDAVITKRIEEILIETQLQSELDFVSIHDIHINSTLKEFEKRLLDSLNQINDSPKKEFKEAAVILRPDMPLDNFKKKIDKSLEQKIKAIIIPFAPIYHCPAQYAHIEEISEESGAVFLLSGVPDSWNGNSKTSMSHIMPLFGFHSVSNRRPIGGSSSKKKKIRKPEYKIFNDDTWGMLNIKELGGIRNGNKACSCSIGENYDVKSFDSAYGGAGKMYSAVKSHNTICGQRALENARLHIEIGELKPFLESKKYMPPAIKNIFNIDLKQRGLDSFIH